MDLTYSRSPGWFAGFLCALLPALPVLFGPIPVAAQAPAPVVVAPCKDACGISLELEAEYGDDSGPGMLDLIGYVSAYRDVSGRTYIVGEPIDNVMVFGPDGRFLRRIGRTGSGPGELETGWSFVLTGDGEFSVFDRGRGVILNFDVSGRLRSEARTAGWVPRGIRTFAWEGPRVVHVADIATPDRAGFPLHLVNTETGEIERSFGSPTGELELGGGLGEHIPVAVRRDGRMWMSLGSRRYDIALLDADRWHRLLRREASWFPERTSAPPVDPDHHLEGRAPKPQPHVGDLVLSESESLLWVRTSIADEEWSPDVASQDRDKRIDEIIEVIDLRTNEVVASQRFDRYFDLVNPLVSVLAGDVRAPLFVCDARPTASK